MQIKFKQTILFVLAIVLLIACDKEGEKIEDMHSWHDVTAYWYYYGGEDDQLFNVSFLQQENGVTIDSVSMSDTLKTSNTIREYYLQFSYSEENTTTRMLLTNITDSTQYITEIDTVVDLRENCAFSFLQMSANDYITLYAGGDNSDVEDPSTTTSTKVQFYYNLDDLPDSVRIVFYSFYDSGTPYYIDSLSEPIDSIDIPNGEFSDYIQLERIGNDYEFFFQIKNTSDGSIIQDISLLNKNLKLSTATGYFNSFTTNNRIKQYYDIRYASNKFMTILLYKSGSKYKDQKLFVTARDRDEDL